MRALCKSCNWRTEKGDCSRSAEGPLKLYLPPTSVSELNYVERQLIAIVNPFARIHLLPYKGTGCSGLVIHLPVDVVQRVGEAIVLPQLPGVTEHAVHVSFDLGISNNKDVPLTTKPVRIDPEKLITALNDIMEINDEYSSAKITIENSAEFRASCERWNKIVSEPHQDKDGPVEVIRAGATSLAVRLEAEQRPRTRAPPPPRKHGDNSGTKSDLDSDSDSDSTETYSAVESDGESTKSYSALESESDLESLETRGRSAKKRQRKEYKQRQNKERRKRRQKEKQKSAKNNRKKHKVHNIVHTKPGSKPQGYWLPETEARSYPHLFPRGNVGTFASLERFYSEPGVPGKQRLKKGAYVSLRLVTRDRRFQADTTWVHDLLQQTLHERALRSMRAIRKKRAQQRGVATAAATAAAAASAEPTASQLADNMQREVENEPLTQADMDTFYRILGRHIRGSAQYWTKVRAVLTSMVSQLGPPQLFLTLSANDLNWPDLYMKIDPKRFPTVESVKAATSAERQALLRDNPALANEHFSRRLTAMRDFRTTRPRPPPAFAARTPLTSVGVPRGAPFYT